MIYENFAFDSDSREKREENQKEYDALCGKYKIYRSVGLKPEINLDDYDIVIGRLPGYNCSDYDIIKNAPNLSRLQLALICDCGNLCFGFSYASKIKGGLCVFED